jgi:Flp pilus assembly pilin Flp
MMMLARLFRRLRRDAGGAIAVEFALTAPFLALGLVAAADLAMTIYRQGELNSTARMAANYMMSESATRERALNLLLASDAIVADRTEVEVEEFCECADGTAVACGGFCPGSQPLRFARIEIRDTYNPILMKERDMRVTLTVRRP